MVPGAEAGAASILLPAASPEARDAGPIRDLGGWGGGGDGISAVWELGFFPWARPSGFSHIPFIVVGSAIPARVSPETP